MKNLVMGFATNQSEESMRIFCQSLRDVYRHDECDVVIITNRHEDYFCDLAGQGVRFEFTPNNYAKCTSRTSKAVSRSVLHALRLFCRLNGRKWLPEIADAYYYLIEMWHHPQLARWFAYRRMLSLNRNYRQVFLADVKDVVFQSPFFVVAPEEKVILFSDGSCYGESFWNDKWYREAYGEEALREVAGRFPVCVGTMLATHQMVLRILDEFTGYMARSPFGRIEQAIFNYMLHNSLFTAKVEVAPNISGIVATLAGKDGDRSVGVSDGAIRRTRDNSTIPVVHMYDRWPELNLFCQSEYGGSSP